MAKNKKKRRNNGGPPRAPRPALPRHSQRKPARKDGDPIDWGTIAATVAGAAGGAIGGAFVAKHTSPTAASAAMTVGGMVGAALADGPMRVAATGVMAAGAGQLALTLMSPRNANLPEYDEAEVYGRRQAALPEPVFRDALHRAQESVAALYPADDYAAHTFAA